MALAECGVGYNGAENTDAGLAEHGEFFGEHILRRMQERRVALDENVDRISVADIGHEVIGLLCPLMPGVDRVARVRQRSVSAAASAVVSATLRTTGGVKMSQVKMTATQMGATRVI